MGEVFLSRDSEDGEADESETFGDYIIEEKLGSGGQGEVFKAKKAGESVALKIAAPSSNGVDKEVSALKALKIQHPNIVSIKEAGVCQGNPFIALELVDGKNLEQILDGFRQIQFGSEEQFMPLSVSINIMEQIAQAIGYAHEKKVYHGDLKPANILITHDNKVKVTDFGLSRIESADLKHSLSLSGEFAGSVGYMSPQRQRGDSLCSADDVFSLGAIWYHMLTNRLPRDDNFQINPSDINKSLPKRVDKIYQRLIAAKPEERYASAGEVVNDLNLLSTFLDKGEARSMVLEQENIFADLKEICFGQKGIHQKFLDLYDDFKGLNSKAKTIILFDGKKIKGKIDYVLRNGKFEINMGLPSYRWGSSETEVHHFDEHIFVSISEFPVYDYFEKPCFFGLMKYTGRVRVGSKIDGYYRFWYFGGQSRNFFDYLIDAYSRDRAGCELAIRDLYNLPDKVRDDFHSDLKNSKNFIESFKL